MTANQLSAPNLLKQLAEYLDILANGYSHCDQMATSASVNGFDDKAFEWDNKMDKIQKNMALLEDAISAIPANDLEDCLAQLVIFGGLIGCDAHERIIRSIVIVLERETGIDREKFGGDYYLTKKYDPYPSIRALNRPRI